jgi:hypothetical protein
MIIAMITSSDLDYKETKLIKQGKKVLKSPLKELADWINKEYGVKVINIYYDYIEDHRPRINIIFEFKTDERKFYDKDYNYNLQKQKSISKKFNELLSINNNESKYNLIADRYTGKVMDRILLKTAPTYIIKKDNILYVRTYNTDYEFDVLMNGK